MSADAVVESIARVCHEVNRAYCTALNDSPQLSWEDAPEETRESARTGVRAHLATPGISPAKSHALWCAEREKHGWTWGLKKNEEKKKHPCLVPFDQLPAPQRAKDYMFAAVVRTLAGIQKP